MSKVESSRVEVYPEEHPTHTVREVNQWTGLYTERPARLIGVTPEGGMYEGGPAEWLIGRCSRCGR